MKKIVTSICMIIVPILIFAQQKTKPVGPVVPDNKSSEPTSGIAVTPSSLRFNAKPGSTASKQVKVTNDTKKPFKFQIGFTDFDMDRNGKPKGIKVNESKYTLSKWVSVSPSYFDLNPGESKMITVTIDVPDKDTANIAAWTIMMIDQATERAPLDAAANGKSIALGVTPSFGFGVYIYQNPPNVKTSSVEIKKFSYKTTKDKKGLMMEVLNTGDGIGFCSSYVELTNKATGKQDRLPIKQYTILPGFHRDFLYPLPDKLASGTYSAVGILDFGSKDAIEASELEFTIP